MIVITRDALPLIVIKNDGQLIEYKVKEIPNGALVDSSCAGDAFAGGLKISEINIILKVLLLHMFVASN